MEMEAKRKMVLDVLQLAKANGCECYMIKPNANYAYGYIIFPDGTPMYVQKGWFWGLDFSISYIPSRETGSGCSCHGEDSISADDIDWQMLLSLKNRGLAFARNLKAKLYPNVDTFIKGRWNWENYERV